MIDPDEIYELWDPDDGTWFKVSKEEYVFLERAAGVHNTMGKPDEPDTAGFSNGDMQGRITYLPKKVK